MERNEFLDILTVLNHLAHADGEMHPSEKKVLIALFRAAKVTPEEQEQIRRHTSLEEMMEEINSDEAKKVVEGMLFGWDQEPVVRDPNDSGLLPSGED